MSLSVRSRRGISCVSSAVSFALLAVEVLWPGLRHRSLAEGVFLCVTAVISIVCGLLYLRSTGRRPASIHMSKADRAAWASARTLADLGELTARWIEGGIASQPGYYGPSDIEDRALVPVLAGLNRAGFVTTGSQPGDRGWGHGGTWWDQRAAVEGFADPDTATCLVRAAQAAGLDVILHCPADLPRWRYGNGNAVPVTMRAGRDYTGFGVQVPRAHIRSPHLGYGICHPAAVNALCQAWQVTVIDPEWGRPDVLWATLAGVLDSCRRPS